MNKAIKNILIISVPSLVILLIFIELFFQFVIPACEFPDSFFDENERIFRYDTTLKQEGIFTWGNLAQEQGKWRINNFGWNSLIDYSLKKHKRRVAIIGDSYIEALHVDIDKSYPAKLRELLFDKYDVISVAKSGAPLSEYLNYARYANKHFDPDIFIFNIVHNDFTESVSELNPSDQQFLTLSITDTLITENIPKPNFSFAQFNWKKRVIKESALYRYLTINLQISKILKDLFSSNEIKKDFNANVKVSQAIINKEKINRAVDYILKVISEENIDKRLVFVIDAPRNDIYDNSLNNSNVLFLHKILKRNCDKYNLELFDLTNPMRIDFENNHTPFNSNINGHWNDYGNYFVAREVFEYLESTESLELNN